MPLAGERGKREKGKGDPCRGGAEAACAEIVIRVCMPFRAGLLFCMMPVVSHSSNQYEKELVNASLFGVYSTLCWNLYLALAAANSRCGIFKVKWCVHYVLYCMGSACCIDDAFCLLNVLCAGQLACWLADWLAAWLKLAAWYSGAQWSTPLIL